MIPTPGKGYLPYVRESVVAAMDGLSEFEVRRPMTPTGTNLLGQIKRPIGMEFGYLGVSAPSPHTGSSAADR